MPSRSQVARSRWASSSRARRTRGCRARTAPAPASPHTGAGARSAQPPVGLGHHAAVAPLLVGADVAGQHQQVGAWRGGGANPDRLRGAGRSEAESSCPARSGWQSRKLLPRGAHFHRVAQPPVGAVARPDHATAHRRAPPAPAAAARAAPVRALDAGGRHEAARQHGQQVGLRDHLAGGEELVDGEHDAARRPSAASASSTKPNGRPEKLTSRWRAAQ
jgi:hypothetical protein